MTLVLATYQDDALLMAADSRVLYLDSVTLQTVGHGLDQKLFIFVDVAIATFGEGADAQQKVPDIINTGLQPDVTFDDAIAFLHQAFRSDPGVQAFVGGITTGGAALRHVWPGKGRELPLLAELTKPPPIWSGGVKNGPIATAAGSTLASNASQMLDLFRSTSKTDEGVGPPFKFVERHGDRTRNRDWQETT